MKDLMDTQTLRITIGKNLSICRHLRAEKQEVPAQAIGVKASVISRIETGTYESLTIDQLLGLCNHYQITLQQVLELEVTHIFNYSQNNQSGTSNNSQVNEMAHGYLLHIKYLKDRMAALEKKLGIYIETENDSDPLVPDQPKSE